MKIGIKSEIHSCTIEIIKILFEINILKINLSSILEKDKELRIENQYYLKNLPVSINIKELRNLILHIKYFLDNLKKEEINQIRKILI